MDPLLSLQRVRFLARDGSVVIDDACVDIHAGQRWSIVGDENSGKNVLLRLMAGLLPAAAGRVMLAGRLLHHHGAAERVSRLGVVFAVADPYFLTARVGEEVALGPSQLGLTGEALQQRVADSLQRAGLPLSLKEETIMNLSASRRYRVALAATLACRPRLVLLQEPGSLLSEAGEEALAETLFHGDGDLATVTFTSRRSRAKRFADHHWVLRQGHLLPTDDV